MSTKMKSNSNQADSQNDRVDITRLDDDLECTLYQEQSIRPTPKSITKTHSLELLLNKEIGRCASQINVESRELKSWLSTYKQVPTKTILHMLRTAIKHDLDPLEEEITINQYDQTWQVSISVDGWIKLINRHPNFAGITFSESPEQDQRLPRWMECTIYRSDRPTPTTVREYLSEVQQEGGQWKKMPRRMLRHRSLQQCARVAMGIIASHPQEQLGKTTKVNKLNLNSPDYEIVYPAHADTKQMEKLKALLQDPG